MVAAPASGSGSIEPSFLARPGDLRKVTADRQPPTAHTMDPSFYKLLHFFGVMTLLLGLGGLLAGESKPSLRLAGVFHGLGLLLLLVSGFGLQAKLDHPFAWWLIAKLVIWLALGGFVVVAKRRLLPAPVAWLIVAVLAGTSAWLGLSHSLMMR